MHTILSGDHTNQQSRRDDLLCTKHLVYLLLKRGTSLNGEVFTFCSSIRYGGSMLQGS